MKLALTTETWFEIMLTDTLFVTKYSRYDNASSVVILLMLRLRLRQNPMKVLKSM